MDEIRTTSTINLKFINSKLNIQVVSVVRGQTEMQSVHKLKLVMSCIELESRSCLFDCVKLTTTTY